MSNTEICIAYNYTEAPDEHDHGSIEEQDNDPSLAAINLDPASAEGNGAGVGGVPYGGNSGGTFYDKIVRDCAADTRKYFRCSDATCLTHGALAGRSAYA